MLDLSQVPTDAPLPFIAIAVLYQIVRKALELHHERQLAKEDEELRERVIKLTAELAEARAEIKHLREEIKKGA